MQRVLTTALAGRRAGFANGGSLSAWAWACAVVGSVAAATSAVLAQDVGGKSAWDGVYATAQAGRGKQAVTMYCVSCHGDDLIGAQAPALNGATFFQRWDFRSVGQLFGEMKERMPRNDPSSLSDATYADIVSYILQVNGFPAGSDELKPQPQLLSMVRIERKKGEEHVGEQLASGTLVLSVGCLAAGDSGGWKLNDASAPMRIDNPDPSKGAERDKIAAIPPGGQTFQLLGIFDKVDQYKGQKMEVKGFLVKDPGGDRINVATLDLLDSNCTR